MLQAMKPLDEADAVLLKDCKVAAHDAERVHRWVKSILEGSKAAEKAYAVKNRVKPFDEIFAKVLAKRNHEDLAQRKPAYRPADVTDISGFRIVSLFNTEIPVALGRLLDLLKTPIPAGSPGSFVLNPVDEIILFSSRAEGDPLSISAEVKAIVREHGLDQKLNVPAAATYSSVHVIVRSRVAVPGGAPLIAASEIQLRSVFEEAWSEINHRLKYAPAKRERARGHIFIDDAGDEKTVLLHLDALKSLTDGCGQYADLIYRDLATRRASRGDRLPQPTDSAELLLQAFRSCSSELYGKVEQAFQFRTEATAAARSVSENPDGASADRKQLFFNAGLLFAEAFGRIGFEEAFGEDARRQKLETILRREMAYCYLFSGNAELQLRAEKLYGELIDADVNNVDALTRLALIKRDAQNVSEARFLMETALREDMQQNPGEHRSQIRWLLCRDLAVLYWEIFESDRASADADALLGRAIELSQQACAAAPTDRQKSGASLNLLYYLAAQYSRADTGTQAALVERAAPLLAAAWADERSEHWDADRLDTLLHAECAFGSQQRAVELATMIIERLKARRTGTPSTPSEALRAMSAEDQDYYLFAMEVLARGSPSA